MLARLVSPSVQLEVSDAALPLLMLRQQALAQWERHGRAESDSHRILSLPPAQVSATVLGLCRELSGGRLDAVTRWISSLQSLIAADAQNRRVVATSSIRMRSFFDAGSLSPEMVRVLAEARDMEYFVGYGPVQMKFFGGREVLVPGRDTPERVGLLLLRGAPALRAATGYVDAVRRASVPAGSLIAPDEIALTPRQHDAARLLAEGLRDADAAERLGVSVRTLRAEVARILEVLGCETRFAAGAKYAVWAASHVDAEPER
jgi:DNA-binding CsgD family transcriptional regulator